MISIKVRFLYLIKKKRETMNSILFPKELYALILFSGQEIGNGPPQTLSNLSKVVAYTC